MTLNVYTQLLSSNLYGIIESQFKQLMSKMSKKSVLAFSVVTRCRFAKLQSQGSS